MREFNVAQCMNIAYNYYSSDKLKEIIGIKSNKFTFL